MYQIGVHVIVTIHQQIIVNQKEKVFMYSLWFYFMAILLIYCFAIKIIYRTGNNKGSGSQRQSKWTFSLYI